MGCVGRDPGDRLSAEQMSQPAGDLEQQAEDFGQEMDGLLRATLPGLPDPPTETLYREGRVVIRPPDASPLPLYVKGQRLASMKLSVSCEPAAHIHVPAHRGALTPLLSQSGHPHPHDMSSLHIPVGGSRFRPCLEDFIQFVISECQFDARDGWRAHVADGRERWRRRQIATVVRDAPEEAVRVLRELSYAVERADPPPAELPKALRNW